MDNSYTLTKEEIEKFKAKEARMTPEQRRAASKALVEANTAANAAIAGRSKKTSKTQSRRDIDKPPTLRERITDCSIGGHSKPVFIPKKKTPRVAEPPSLEERITDYESSPLKDIRFIPKKKNK